MDIRHRNKAIVGLVIWTAALLVGIVTLMASRNFVHAPGTNFLSHPMLISLSAALVVQYGAFFWGGSQLAQAKGYSSGMVVIGILWPAQILIWGLLLFALPDKCAHRKTRSSRASGRHASIHSHP
jgi:hypothetical protein